MGGEDYSPNLSSCVRILGGLSGINFLIKFGDLMDMKLSVCLTIIEKISFFRFYLKMKTPSSLISVGIIILSWEFF